jgi:hypothetical protein
MSALLILLSAGCYPDIITNDPIARVYAEDMAVRGGLAARLTVGAAALSASACGIGHEGWSGQDGEEFSPTDPVAAMLGLPGPGLISYNSDTGAIEVEWEGAELASGVYGTVVMNVLRATTSFNFSITVSEEYQDAANEYGFRDASVAVTVGNCQDDVAAVFATANLPSQILSEDELQATVSLPVDGAEDEEGMVWTRGEGLPDSGDFVWTIGSGADRERLISYDAGEISDGYWPSLAEGRDWTLDIDVPIER